LYIPVATERVRFNFSRAMKYASRQANREVFDSLSAFHLGQPAAML
jgi:hypothetical protein